MPILDPNAIHWVSAPLVADPGGNNGRTQASINFDETYRPRPLSCKQCGWIIGVVMRQRTENRSVRRLWVFVEAIDNECHVPAASVLRSSQRNLYRVHGLDQSENGVECSHCGNLNPWNMSLESYLRLVNHYRASD